MIDGPGELQAGQGPPPWLVRAPPARPCPPQATQPRVQLVRPLLVRNLFPLPHSSGQAELSKAVFSSNASICLLPATQNVPTFPAPGIMRIFRASSAPCIWDCFLRLRPRSRAHQGADRVFEVEVCFFSRGSINRSRNG